MRWLKLTGCVHIDRPEITSEVWYIVRSETSPQKLIRELIVVPNPKQWTEQPLITSELHTMHQNDYARWTVRIFPSVLKNRDSLKGRAKIRTTATTYILIRSYRMPDECPIRKLYAPQLIPRVQIAEYTAGSVDLSAIALQICPIRSAVDDRECGKCHGCRTWSRNRRLGCQTIKSDE